MNSVAQYTLVTLAYWGFTLTDGALRMLVLLHFHSAGYTAFQVASLFLLYEIFGIITNLGGGWIAAHFGLKSTLVGGLVVQILALVMLANLSSTWSFSLSIVYVMIAQALSGIAKDLTKMSAKSGIKFLVPKNAPSRLFKWVAILTGSKNALKGIGFFLGGFLLSEFGFINSLYIMAGTLTLITLTTTCGLKSGLGKMKSKVKIQTLFSMSRDINFLSAARFFLFGARDVWFVVALPVFLQEVLGWGFKETGSFLALWVIGYGFIQSLAPVFFRKSWLAHDANGGNLQFWAVLLALIPAGIAILLTSGKFDPSQVVIIGLMLFGVVFAINSAVHSFLILTYAHEDKVTLNVGFYYMANAGGRLIGTILSGAMYQVFGLAGCLWLSTIFVLSAVVASHGLRERPALSS